MSVTGNDLSLLEGRPNELSDLLVGRRVSDLLLHGENESKNFLVRETVKGSGESTESGRVRQEGVGEGGSDEICQVRKCYVNSRVRYGVNGKTDG